MSGGSGRDQFIGDLSAKRTQQVKVSKEERQMGVMGIRVERIHLHRKMSPVLEELPDYRHRQFALTKLRHEMTIVNFLVPGLVERDVQIFHICFGFLCIQFFTGIWLSWLAQVLPPRTVIFI